MILPLIALWTPCFIRISSWLTFFAFNRAIQRITPTVAEFTVACTVHPRITSGFTNYTQNKKNNKEKKKKSRRGCRNNCRWTGTHGWKGKKPEGSKRFLGQVQGWNYWSVQRRRRSSFVRPYLMRTHKKITIDLY